MRGVGSRDAYIFNNLKDIKSNKENLKGGKKDVVSKTTLCLPHADPLLKRALDKYFRGETNGSDRWHFYHDDQRRFYESEHSKTIRRLKAEKSKLSCMDK